MHLLVQQHSGKQRERVGDEELIGLGVPSDGQNGLRSRLGHRLDTRCEHRARECRTFTNQGLGDAYDPWMGGQRPQPPGQSVVQLRIELAEVDPPVWRRLIVPGSVRLARLHSMVQAAMGWTDSHLHCFRIGDELYGMQYDEHPDDEIDETTVTVLRALSGHDRFFYDYDFGDSWEHEVVVESMTTTPTGLRFAVCLDGQSACPPEDCGGAGRYAYLLQALADPTHEEHDDLTEWVGGPFDPTAFDLAATNAALQQVR